MVDRALKIVSYNILDGGLGRLDPIYETLSYLDADIVGLCEADDPRGVRYLAEKLDMDFVTAEGEAPRAVALLSRWPVRNMVNLSVRDATLDRGAMEAVVEVNGQPLRVAIVHLQAGQRREDEDRRLTQLDALFGALNGQALATVLMGDFNAAAPYHPFDLHAASPKVQGRLAERGASQPDHDAIRAIEKRGWLDAYHRLHPEQPRHTYTTGFPASRFDYIWVSADLADRLAEADVECGGFAPYCSDHYPIWTALRF